MKVLIILLSSLIGAAFSLVGIYLTIHNLITPQGYLFEGLALLGIGTLSTLMVMVSLSLGKTIMAFGKIMEGQVELQKEVDEARKRMEEETSKPSGGLGSLFSGLAQMPGIENGMVVDLTDPDGFKNFLNKIQGGKGSAGTKSIYSMNVDELRTALDEAIKKDNFEEAAKINRQIKALENKGDEDQEEENEN
ncbi:MAG: UvrB/UvrC motif-containing protein [Acholeplasmataceae bacterium]